jgi:hypothetical protein
MRLVIQILGYLLTSNPGFVGLDPIQTGSIAVHISIFLWNVCVQFEKFMYYLMHFILPPSPFLLLVGLLSLLA